MANNHQKTIYLTFDDGPNEPCTSQILGLLKKYNAHATFFVIGQNIKRSPGTLNKILEDGHALGIHTFSHKKMKVLAGNYFDEIIRTQNLITEQTGLQTYLYRSPWGITQPWLKRQLNNANFRTFHWDIMAHDWWNANHKYMARHVISRVFDNAIILLHDGNQTSLDNRNNTIEALEIVLSQLSAQGYQFKELASNATAKKIPIVKNLFIDNLAWLTRGAPLTIRLAAATVLVFTIVSLMPSTARVAQAKMVVGRKIGKVVRQFKP